jgi:transcriptional regulator with XRE-family HTH domain
MSDGRRRAHSSSSTTAPLTRANCLRLARGLTYEQLAQRAGLAVRTVTRVLQDESPWLVARLRVAQALDGDAAELWPDVAELVGRPAVPAVVSAVPAKRRRSTRVA